MQRTEEFWEWVHDLLDHGKDPVDDADVRGFLLAHPDCLEEFAALRDAIASVERSVAPAPVTTSRPHRPARIAAVAAAVLLLVAGALVLGPLRGERDRDSGTGVAREPVSTKAPAAPRSRILWYRTTVSTRSHRSEIEIVSGPDGWVARTTLRPETDRVAIGPTRIQLERRGRFHP